MSDLEALFLEQKSVAQKIERLLANFKKDSPSRKTKDYLGKRENELESLWKEFVSNNEEILKSVEPEHAYCKENLFKQTFEIYSIALDAIITSKKNLQIIELKEELARLEQGSVNAEKSPASQPSFNSSNAIYAETIPKLPRITIPKFSGDYKEWKNFHELFLSVIHNNPNISSVEKLQYFLCHLDGEAKRIVAHLQLNASNYETALHLVEARYNNHRKIVTTYINAILDAKRIDTALYQDVIKLYDLLRECLQALKNLDCKTDDWGPIIVCIVMRKLDQESLKLFEETIPHSREMPTMDDLYNFLEKRYHVLESIKVSKPINQVKKSLHISVGKSCKYCGKGHKIYECTDFKSLPVSERQSFVNKSKWCANCLLHPRTEKCKSARLCFICNNRHHTLLHRGVETMSQKTVTGKGEESPTKSNSINCHLSSLAIPNVQLATATVRVHNLYGQPETLRALIDPGSQASLITEDAVQLLKLPKQRIAATVSGVNDSRAAKSSSLVSFYIQSRISNFKTKVQALVLPKLNLRIPDSSIDQVDIRQYGNILLADPSFGTPAPIDLLLGADIYSEILLNGFIKNKPSAQNTKLGWILFGGLPCSASSPISVSSFVTLAELDQKLESFWEMGDTQNVSTLDDNDADLQYTRDTNGRFSFRLPFKSNPGTLGDSRKMAFARYLYIERQLKGKPEVLAEYNKFLAEYLALGHMSLAKWFKGDNSKVYYLPHHAVFKPDSTTTKIRVVFDASAETDSGVSLNDTLITGKKLQQDLAQIFLRWRKHRYAFTADIEKMFRGVLIDESDRDFLRIFWRPKPGGPIQEFALNTVTYGTGPAVYLAVKALNLLAESDGDKFPLAKKALMTDFCVDDGLIGADTRDEACRLQRELIELLKLGGFNLRKWTANDEQLLKHIPEDLREKGVLEITDEDTVKTLGVHWNPKRDELQFRYSLVDADKELTKRYLLSKMSSIFDPLGWLAPLTFSFKCLMQSIWQSGTGWDQQVLPEIKRSWEKIEAELIEIEKIRIPRWFYYGRGQKVELHGFCDASEKGYGAVIYARATSSSGKIVVTLLAAKTRVAPMKQKITLPRLELCGALLLAQLIKFTLDSLGIQDLPVTAWCDSEIALAWISKDPSTWNTFVANRVSQIQNLLPTTIWRHVSSGDNPADVASRGASPSRLVAHTLWWRGPVWLSRPIEAWPLNKFNLITSQESRKIVSMVATNKSDSSISDNLFKSSNFSKQTRIIAYCKRFITNCKLPFSQRNFHYLSTNELIDSRNIIVRTIQSESFFEEIDALKRKLQLKTNSPLLRLVPFIDNNGILRVGGRLQNSDLPEDVKHQILLPQKHRITGIIIDHAHRQVLHGGVQQTLAYIRNAYWITNGASVVQTRLRRCIRCLRFQQQGTFQQMGNQPSVRITPSPPFSHCGVDYAGPVLTKMSKGRGTKVLKGYIALFVCMATKAVHLELVSDLTTDAFLAAYKRFVSRRGHCVELFSDNGTNFVGAKKEMDNQLKEAIDNATQYAAEITALDGTQWKFIPPGTPHVGGLWEAGVKSVKKHLRRVLGETLLTFEEFSTVLCQIEACLNSRPIAQLSSDPRDYEPLTPGHFIIGRPIIAPPEPEIADMDLHQRWKLLSRLHQHFWQRWSKEYLTSLQRRSKWIKECKGPSVGELVILKDESLPPTKWPLGRVVDVHPGSNGLTRIVSVRCRNTVKKRHINNLIQLPYTSYNDNTPSPLRANPPLKAAANFISASTVLKAGEGLKRSSRELEHEALNRSSGDMERRPPSRKRPRIAPFLSIIVCYVSSEDCGQEELTNCARPLQILQSTSELSIAAKKEELEKLCPDLYNGLHCIRSYTRRCMTLQQRNQFNKMYHGTNQVIRDLCKEGQYQDEFLKHAPCLRVVQAEYEVCAKRYQETMAFINQAKSQENVTLTEDESVRTVCCSFTEYLDCSEQAARKTCGEETAQFTRGFLDKMSSTLVKTYCDSYYKGSGRCREFESSATTLKVSTALFSSIFMSLFYLFR